MLEINDSEGVRIFPPVTTKFIDVVLENYNIDKTLLKSIKDTPGNHPAALMTNHYYMIYTYPITDTSVDWSDPENILIARFHSPNGNIIGSLFYSNGFLYIIKGPSNLTPYTSVTLTIYKMRG